MNQNVPCTPMPALPQPNQVLLRIRLGGDTVTAAGSPDDMVALMDQLARRSAEHAPKPVVVPLRGGQQWVVQPRAITSMGWASAESNGIAYRNGDGLRRRGAAEPVEIPGEPIPEFIDRVMGGGVAGG